MRRVTHGSASDQNAGMCHVTHTGLCHVTCECVTLHIDASHSLSHVTHK